MFTTRNRQRRRSQAPESRVKHPIACFMLMLLILVITPGTSSAQCTYKTSGYIFLHPFFRAVNWEASVFTSWIEAPESMCEKSVQQFATTHDPSSGISVFTDDGGKWFTAAAPLVNDSCVCCQSQITFGEPVVLDMPSSLGLRPASHFAVVRRTQMPKDSACLIAASDTKVYAVHFSTAAGTVGPVDTLDFSLPDNSTITGIWQEPNSTVEDTVLWITGTNGLLAKVILRNGQPSSAAAVATGGTETFLCTDGTVAGTVSGKIYKRSSDGFVFMTDVASRALRFIADSLAVGDNGLIAVQKNGDWKAYTKGTANYRYGTLSGSRNGTMAELIDDHWNYSAQVLFDTPSSFGTVQPAAVKDDGQHGGVYEFTANSPQTMSFTIDDPDNNRQIPALWYRHDNSDTLIIDSTMVPRQNPAAVCTTQLTLFTESPFALILGGSTISVKVPVVKSVFDAGCQFWRWQKSTITVEKNWSGDDTLFLSLPGDTLRICNKAGGVVTTTHRRILQNTAKGITIRIGTSLLTFPSRGQIRPSTVTISDLLGRRSFRTSLTTSDGTIPILSASGAQGIRLISVTYQDGTTVTQRLVLQR